MRRALAGPDLFQDDSRQFIETGWRVRPSLAIHVDRRQAYAGATFRLLPCHDRHPQRAGTCPLARTRMLACGETSCPQQI